jgi:DNA-binding transcriptional regulator YiaG
MKSKTKNKKRAVPLRCSECEGTLKPAKLSNFDFTQWAGLSSSLEAVPGLRCDTCGGETIPGIVINQLLITLALAVIQLPHRLPPAEARYLRRCLQVTQQELADRMGVERETVAQWECARKEISSQHDLILRTFLLNKFYGEHRISTALLEMTMLHLGAVKSTPPPPPKERQPMHIPASEYENMLKVGRPRRRGPATVHN